MSLASTFATPAAKLGAYGVGLVLALGGGALVGSAVGPSPAPPTTISGHDADDGPNGGTVAVPDGSSIVLEPAEVAADTSSELALTIVGRDGAAGTDPAVELRLVVVSHDLATVATLGDVQPTGDPAGRWTATLPPLAPGAYRVLATLTTDDHDGVVIGAELTVTSPTGHHGS